MYFFSILTYKSHETIKSLLNNLSNVESLLLNYPTIKGRQNFNWVIKCFNFVKKSQREEEGRREVSKHRPKINKK